MDQTLPPGAPSDLFITEALDLRPTRAGDYRRQGRAIQELAFRMAADPETILPQYVEVAMQVTGGSAAGVSLYEQDPAPGVFRWRFLRGALARFDGATTPRHYSPCGITLDSNGPQLTRHPERAYSWIAEAGIECAEVLLVPLYLNGPEPLGTLWVVSDEEGRFTRDDARVLGELAENVGSALRFWRAEQAGGVSAA